MNETPINDRYEDNQAISLMARDQYVREVAWIQALEPLTSQEEDKLLGYLQRAKDEPGNAWAARRAQYARERLVEAYQPVVMAVARHYVGRFQSMEWLDLVNEGNTGLLALLDEYVQEPAYRGHFRGLVAIEVRHALWRARNASDGGFRLPDHIASLISRMRRVIAQADAALSVHQLAEMLGVSENQVLEAKVCMTRQRVVSLEGLIDEEEDAEDRHHFVNLFASEVREHQERQGELQQAFARLFEQELVGQGRRVMELRYALDEGVTAARPAPVVADMLGVDPTVVNGLERQALARLRTVLAGCSGVPDGETVEARVDSEQWYTRREVAQLLGISETYVPYLVARGRLPAVAGPRRLHGRSVEWAFPKLAIDELVSEYALPVVSAQEVIAGQVSRGQVLSRDFYTIREVAGLLGVGVEYVGRLARQGRLLAVAGTFRLDGCSVKWIFPRSAIDGLVRARAEQGCEAVSA